MEEDLWVSGFPRNNLATTKKITMQNITEKAKDITGRKEKQRRLGLFRDRAIF